MPKVPQLVSVEAGTQIQVCLIPKPQFSAVGYEGPGEGAVARKEAGRKLL